MISTGSPVNTSTQLQNSPVLINFKTDFPSHFKICNTGLLTIVTMLYIRIQPFFILQLEICTFDSLDQFCTRISPQFTSVQLLSHVWLFVTLWIAARQAFLSITNSWSLPKLISIESVMPSNHLSSPSPPALNLSQHQGLFKWVSSSHQMAKILEFKLQHQSFQWTPNWSPLG